MAVIVHFSLFITDHVSWSSEEEVDKDEHERRILLQEKILTFFLFNTYKLDEEMYFL